MGVLGTLLSAGKGPLVERMVFLHVKFLSQSAVLMSMSNLRIKINVYIPTSRVIWGTVICHFPINCNSLGIGIKAKQVGLERNLDVDYVR